MTARFISVSTATPLRHRNIYGSPTAAAVPGPVGGHWLIGSEGELYRDSSQEQLLTLNESGRRVHLLHRVPTQGWHQFRVRDEAASARLRTVTAGQVKELLEVLPGG